MSVIFDGNNHLIIVGSGIYELNAQEDLYSAWKDWMTSGDNMKYYPVFDTPDGGRDLSPALKNGDYYFLNNQDFPALSGASGWRDGWRIRPSEANHELVINGNLYVSDINKPWVVPTLGGYTVIVRLATSSLTQTVVSGSGVTQQDKEDIAEMVWIEDNRELSNPDNYKADPTVIAQKTWDEQLTAATHNIPTSAGRRLRNLGDAVDGSVNDPNPTTISFITNLTETTDNHYSNQYIRFVEGNLAGMVRIIGLYDGTTKKITICDQEPFPEPPLNGEDFVIIPVHVHPLKEVIERIWGAQEYTDLTNLTKQLREKNISYTFVKATQVNLTRNVAIGVLDYIEIKIKNDADDNWDNPVDTARLYMWYENVGDTNPLYVGESD